MEREPVSNPRCYRHNCPAHGNREQQITKEICPECGQRGEFYRWSIGMYARIGRLQRVLGFPCVGPQMTFLPTMTRSCQRCHDEGILAGDDFDYECPDCNGLGKFIDRTDEEMRKIRRWATMRHEQDVMDKQHPEKYAKCPPTTIPDNFVLDRNPITFARRMMNMFEYSKKFSTRNHQIGELMLGCDDHGWDVFMEMIELWENSGRGLAVSQYAIFLQRSLRKNAVTLLSIYPPSDDQPERVLVNRQKIRRLVGRETKRELWERFANLNPNSGEWIHIDERFTKEEARKWILRLLSISG